MAGPFYNNIRSIASGTPGTGAFTTGVADAGSLSFSTVPAGWIGLVRFEDGAAWELRYSYWNGTTLTRGANAFVASSTGSGLTLTSAATATMVIDGAEVNPHLGGNHVSLCSPQPGANAMNQLGAADTPMGTSAAATIAATNFLTEQPRIQRTSATTAHAAAGINFGTSPRSVYSTAAGRGGAEFVARFGVSQLPTAPKLWCGFQKAVNSSANEPSSYFDTAMFAKDSTDTNIQFMTNDASGAATKTDTGIALVTTAFYETSIWYPPGGGKVCGLLIRLDTGDIWYGERTSDLPTNGSLHIPTLYGSLSATTGTAIVVHLGVVMVRTGG